MQIQWHGRDGFRGQDKSILTIILKSAITAQPGGVGPDGREHPGRPGQTQKLLKLLPGINGDVPAADWEEAKKHEVVKHYLDNGHLEVIEADTLAKFTPEQAKRMIGETIDKALLARWRAADQRDVVHKAIDEHLEKMSPKAAQQKQGGAKA